MKIKKIRKIKKSKEVYNLHIQDNHNYFANDICVSNCHNQKANVIRSISENAKNAEYRIGFTGTLPDPISEKTQIIATLGPVVDLVEHKDLVKDNLISKIKISIPYLKYTKDEKKQIAENIKIAKVAAKLSKKPTEVVAYNIEREFLYNSKKRNTFIAKVAKKATGTDKNTLILLNKHEHIEKLTEALRDIGIEPTVITGKVKDMELRNKIRKDLEIQAGNIVIATSGVYSTGISVKRLHTVIFADAGKSKITTLQSVGRGLRMHATKTHLHLIDIADDLNYGESHLNTRLQYYAKNEFEVTIKEVMV